MKARSITYPFDIVSWNIDFASSQASRRCLSIINRVFENGVPDILCLQEVRSEVQNTQTCLFGYDISISTLLSGYIDIDIISRLLNGYPD